LYNLVQQIYNDKEAKEDNKADRDEITTKVAAAE
jgi:hypothetical protein